MAAARRAMLMRNEDNLDETSADIDELSHELQSNKQKDIAANIVERIKSFKDDLETSFDRERSSMEEYFDNEKHDIMKGFLLEKQILNKEHEKEKQGLIETFVKERQKMLQDFQKQVKEIESKIKTSPNEYGEPESVISIPREMKKNPDNTDNSSSSKILIKLNGNRVITPQEFLATLELEENFEAEKESIEKSFRKEKERMKDKLAVEYERKVLREKQKHENEIKELQKDIENLKGLKTEVSSIWKQQATKLEAEFHKERVALEKHYKTERENLRKKMDDRSESKLRKQQQQYDRSIGELKSELRRIKQDAVNQENVVIDNTHKIKHDVTKQIQESFERETKIIREQNEKLSEDVKQLTTEKYKLSQSIREMEINTDNEMKTKEQKFEKCKKEYEHKLRKLTTQLDRLKIQFSENEKQRQYLSQRAETNENDTKTIEERLIITERTVSEYEDTIVGMRIENTNLSHEINLLRNEKDDLLRTIEKCQESERGLKVDFTRLQHDFTDSEGRYALLEREKLQNEKLVASLRKELEANINFNKETNTKSTCMEKEAKHLRQLLEGERKENKRLHTRFKQDADSLRKKENENINMRMQLDNIKTEFANLKSKIETDDEKILEVLSEKETLQNEVKKLKTVGSTQHQRDLINVQNQFVKEFAKRLDYVKSNYEREIRDLKNTIETLKHLKTTSCCDSKLSKQRKETKSEMPCITTAVNSSNTELDSFIFSGCDSTMGDQSTGSFVLSCQSQNKLFEDKDIAGKGEITGVNENTDNVKGNEIRTRLQKRTKLSKSEDENVLNHSENNSAFRSVSQKCMRTTLLKKLDKQGKCDENMSPPPQKLPEVPIKVTNGCYDVRRGSDAAMFNLMERISSAESNPDNDELRQLLKDVRSEVLLLNKMIEESTSSSTPRLSPMQNPYFHMNGILSTDEAKGGTYRVENQLAHKEVDITDSKEEIKRLHEENNELQRRITEQEQEIIHRGSSCDELLQRRMALEKLVDRLQIRLREETSRRRHLEQEKNAINEETREELDDDSTV